MNYLEIESRQSEKTPHGVAFFVRLKVHPSFLHPHCRHAPALWQSPTSSMSPMARVHFYARPPKFLREGRRLLHPLERCHPHSPQRSASHLCPPWCHRQETSPASSSSAGASWHQGHQRKWASRCICARQKDQSPSQIFAIALHLGNKGRCFHRSRWKIPLQGRRSCSIYSPWGSTYPF